jgi:hypothetical protein
LHFKSEFAKFRSINISPRWSEEANNIMLHFEGEFTKVQMVDSTSKCNSQVLVSLQRSEMFIASKPAKISRAVGAKPAVRGAGKAVALLRS